MINSVSRLLIMIVLLIINFSGLLQGETPKNSKKTIKDQFYFFPKGIFNAPQPINKDFDQDKSIRDLYSKNLKSMKEPSISISEHEFESAYRFLWLRTFNHPIAVRIEKLNGQIILYAVELSGKGGYDPGVIKKSKKKELSHDDFNRLSEILKEIDFWNMDNVLKILNTDGTITLNADGAQWILEGNSNGKYHVVDRWSPEAGKYKELCLYFLQIAGFKIKTDDIY